MGLYIRDDRVRDLAKELAARRSTTVTEIVRNALEREKAEDDRVIEEKIRRTLEIAAEVQSLPDYWPGLTDKDLYDDEGSPIL